MPIARPPRITLKIPKGVITGLPPTPIAQKAPKIMMSKIKMTVLMFSPLDHARVMEEKAAHVTPAISAKK